MHTKISTKARSPGQLTWGLLKCCLAPFLTLRLSPKEEGYGDDDCSRQTRDQNFNMFFMNGT